MAITPTPAHYEGFVYGAVDSHTYGVVISDTNAYDSAGRAVEMITIPGRNGAYAMDHKRYENIEITYHCSIPATDPADFISAISDLRNALGALTGYNRLTDDFNDNEYRMAVLKGGVGVTNINPQAGTFDVLFDCKPQRFLTSGETATAVTSGGTVTNPTLYPASPQLQVWGYGDITINGETLSISNVPIGQTVLYPGGTGWQGTVLQIDSSILNVGDTVQLDASRTAIVVRMSNTVTNVQEVSRTPLDLTVTSVNAGYVGSLVTFDATIMEQAFPYATGTNRTATVVVEVTFSDSTTTNLTYTITLKPLNAQGEIELYATPAGSYLGIEDLKSRFGTVIGISTQSALGSPLYFDLDIGEAYNMDSGSVVSVNNAVTIPARLPVLKPGANTITYDNTITQFKIVPRWWKL